MPVLDIRTCDIVQIKLLGKKKKEQIDPNQVGVTLPYPNAYGVAPLLNSSYILLNKDKLDISSHKKKRTISLKRDIQRGLLDVEKADPFSLFVESGGITCWLYRDSERILGNTFSMCILQVASWGAYLWRRNVIAMSGAPKDFLHEAQGFVLFFCKTLQLLLTNIKTLLLLHVFKI